MFYNMIAITSMVLLGLSGVSCTPESKSPGSIELPCPRGQEMDKTTKKCKAKEAREAATTTPPPASTYNPFEADLERDNCEGLYTAGECKTLVESHALCQESLQVFDPDAVPPSCASATKDECKEMENAEWSEGACLLAEIPPEGASETDPTIIDPVVDEPEVIISTTDPAKESKKEGEKDSMVKLLVKLELSNEESKPPYQVLFKFEGSEDIKDVIFNYAKQATDPIALKQTQKAPAPHVKIVFTHNEKKCVNTDKELKLDRFLSKSFQELEYACQ